MNGNAIRMALGVAMAFSIILTWSSCSRDAGSKIVIKGSTTVLPIVQKVAEAYTHKNPGISISIEGSGSGNGIRALTNGSCEIANSSRHMRPEEIAKAKENGVAVKEIEIGIDMICPVVHPDNPVRGLSMGQLKAIYDGSISNWKLLGGLDEAIVIVSRDTSSGTYEAWHETVMHKTDVRKDALLQASNGAVATTVAGNPKAIGYIGYGYISDTVRALKVNDVAPTIETGRLKRFPLSRHLYMYINDVKISEQSRGFVDYILSEEGQSLVKAAGFIPLR
jgi:phosphate transport system substrate-binding protein